MRKISLLTLVAAFVVTLSLPVGADSVFTPSTTSGPVGSTVTFVDTYCYAGSGGWARAYIGADQSTPWTYTETTAAAGTGYVGDVNVVVPANAVVGAAELWVECEEGDPAPFISAPQAFTVTAGGGGGGNGGGGGTGGGGTGGSGTDTGGEGAGSGGGDSAPAAAPVAAQPSFTG